MGKPGIWIFIILVVLWQIVGRLVERAAVKQRQQKLAEMARQKQPAPERPTATAAAAGEDLAARRRAQIDELRQRRETRLGPAGPGSIQRPVRTAVPGPVARPVGRPAARPAPRPAPIPVPPRSPAPARARAAVPPAPPPRSPERPDEPVSSLLEDIGPPAAAPPARRPASILGGKVDHQMLRRVAVLREILDPPVSLRDPYTAAP